MITESYHNYKGYTIRLRAVTGNGFWYRIIKQSPNESSPNGIKNIFLKEQGFNFIPPDELLTKAKNYIDNFPSNLENKFIKLTTKTQNNDKRTSTGTIFTR